MSIILSFKGSEAMRLSDSFKCWGSGIVVFRQQQHRRQQNITWLTPLTNNNLTKHIKRLVQGQKHNLLAG